MELISLRKDLLCAQRGTLRAKERGGVEILISGVRGGNKNEMANIEQDQTACRSSSLTRNTKSGYTLNWWHANALIEPL